MNNQSSSILARTIWWGLHTLCLSESGVSYLLVQRFVVVLAFVLGSVLHHVLVAGYTLSALKRVGQTRWLCSLPAGGSYLPIDAWWTRNEWPEVSSNAVSPSCLLNRMLNLVHLDLCPGLSCAIVPAGASPLVRVAVRFAPSLSNFRKDGPARRIPNCKRTYSRHLVRRP